jgi:adenylylsulfate kinase
MSIDPKGTNITWHASRVSKEARHKLLNQHGAVIWMTGLSGSGKSTIACLLEEGLAKDGHLAYILDGDNIRYGLNRDLGFSAEDRVENIRRIGEVAALFAKAGVIVITAFISPYVGGRWRAREAAGEAPFVEVFLDTPLKECEQRDPKGLYKKARDGELSDFTGIDAPYEKPVKPELTLKTGELSPLQCADHIREYLKGHCIYAERY